MKLRVSCTYVAVFVAVFSAFPVHASDWAVVPAISTTLGIKSGRLCVCDGSRRDICCPTFAPSVTTAGDVSVTGNLSANKSIGDGSGLTGIGQGDRITSSSLSVIANETTNYVSLTTSGSTWGYFNDVLSYLPTLWSTSVSATNISGTTAHFSGNVGIGTNSPDYKLDVQDGTSSGELRFRLGSTNQLEPFVMAPLTTGYVRMAVPSLLTNRAISHSF